MRADYCPIGGEPCQSLCAKPCSARKIVDFAVVRQLVDALRMVMDDPDALDGRPRTYEYVQEVLAAAKEAGL